MILSLLCSIEMIDSSHNYQVQNGLNVISGVGASFKINSIRMKSKLVCLAACCSNQECLTTVYIESVENDNCILYKKHFDSNETTTSSNTKMFLKKSKYRIQKIIKWRTFFKETFSFKIASSTSTPSVTAISSIFIYFIFLIIIQLLLFFCVR